jgi:transcriptional regulator with XRE-family HTH domain
MPPSPCIRAAPEPANDGRSVAHGRRRSSDTDRFLGHRIKELRVRAGLTQRQVAEQLGISRQQVHRIEKGTTQLSAVRLLAIARLFNIALAEIFDGYESTAPLRLLDDAQTSRMLLTITRSFVRLEPKQQDALVRLARAMAEEG